MNDQGLLDIKESQKRANLEKEYIVEKPIINIVREDIHNHKTITILFF